MHQRGAECVMIRFYAHVPVSFPIPGAPIFKKQQLLRSHLFGDGNIWWSSVSDKAAALALLDNTGVVGLDGRAKCLKKHPIS